MQAPVIFAIADGRRRAIFERFARQPGKDMSIDDVALAFGIHRSVAFTHLETLACAGLLVRGDRGGRRGRPSRVYKYAGSAAEASHPARNHRFLAEVLALGLAAQSRKGRLLARRQAAAAGHKIAAGARSDAGCLAALDALGFDYRLDAGVITAGNCLFREACDSARELVCDTHAALIEGALEATGRHRPVTPLGLTESGGCAFKLEEL